MATVPPLIPGLSGSFGMSSTSTTSNRSGSQKKVLSQEAVDKLIYDVMSSDQGLAALASGENSSGGYGSSTKGLMAQDLTAKLVGEIANITAETITTEAASSKEKSKSGKVGTVICTELVRLGLMDRKLYDAGHSHFSSLHPFIVLGYQSWALRVVPLMESRPLLCKFLLAIAVRRYQYIVNGKFSITGAASVYLAQPVCGLIGAIIAPFVAARA